MAKRTSIAVEFRSDTTDIKRGADEVRKEMQKLKAHSEAMKVRMVEPPSVSAAQASARAMMAAWGTNVQTVQRDNLAQAVSAQAMFQRQAAQQARTLGGGNLMGQSGAWNFAGGGGGSAGKGAGGAYGRGSTNAGMGMLMLSQGIDDMQYGLRGVINNIAPLVMALGGGTGLAGVLTIGAVAASEAAKAWDRLNNTTALANANAEAAIRYEQTLAEMRKRASEAGRASGEAALSRVMGTTGSRASMDQWQQRESRAAGISMDASGIIGQKGNPAWAESIISQRTVAVDRLARDQQSEAEMKERIKSATVERSGLSEFSNRAAEIDAELPGLNESMVEIQRRINESKLTIVDLQLEEAEIANKLLKAKEAQSKEEEAAQEKLRQRLNSWNQSINDTAVEFHEFGIAMRQLAQSIKDTQQNIVKDETRKAEIARLRRVGRNAKADKMEDEDAVKDLQQQGLTKEQAENVVAMRRQTQEGGNRRIRQKRTQQKEENINPWKNPEAGLKRNKGGKEGGFFDGLADAGTEKVVSLLTQIKEKLNPLPGERNTPKDQRKL